MTTSREEFDRLMNEQRERAREDRKKMGDLGWQSEDLGLDKSIKTAFDGYDTLEESAKILAIVNEGEVSGAAAKGEKITVVLDHTPFYAEMGGQIGDHGVITGKNGAMTVSDVQKTKDGKYMHIGVVTEGELSVEDEVTASVDAAYRQAICRAHTSTHLLQKALRKVLGDHVEQAGSYTANDHIRFDFTHFAALTPEELAKVEELVNDAILAGSPVITEEMCHRRGKEEGRYGAVRREVRPDRPRGTGRRLHRAVRRYAPRQHRKGRLAQDHRRGFRCCRRPPYRGRYRQGCPPDDERASGCSERGGCRSQDQPERACPSRSSSRSTICAP